MSKLIQVAALTFVLLFARVGLADEVCVGDCDGGGGVTVDEIISGVNIALGQAAVSTCPAFDSDGSGSVTVDEILTAVNHALTGCPEPPREPGPPVAGMAEGYADYPVGAPLGGYTARCRCFGGSGRYDARRSAYVSLFNPSIGVQTQPKIVALWLENGVQELVLIKTDQIYTFEGVVNAVAARLSAATGRNLEGRVILASNHTHSAPANFDQGVTWFLGGDKFNREIFERSVASIADVALRAYESRQPAAIGIGQKVNWDPNNRVYSDRRVENNEKRFFDDITPGSYKDPYLTVLRVDTAAGAPLGMFFAFGMHGTVAGDNNQMWSTEASGHVESVVEERLGRPMAVGYMQHGGGDASPRGVDDLFATMESVGEFGADAIVDLWENTPTSSMALRMETITRSLDTRRDSIQVHREYGTLTYSQYVNDPLFRADDIVYDDEGRIRTPIDEFNTQYGGAFCGSEDRPLPGQNIGSNAFPYSSCGEVGALGPLIAQIFRVGTPEIPLPESLRAKVTASRLGPLPIRQPDGTVVTDDALLAFFPGETTAVYTEQFRRRARVELGMEHAIPFGYAQDHQGYLLTPEDWLLGGYEPNINLWGPLQGEHIMEGLLKAADDVLLTEEIEPRDPPGAFPDPVYPAAALPTSAPDLTPNAGRALSGLPSYFLIPLKSLPATHVPPAQARRVQDIVQFMWEGGDPGVDLPVVKLERQGEGGQWQEVTTASGRTVSSPMHDMLLSTTPNPLSAFEQPQVHTWWVGWQVVSHVSDRAGLPLGKYRFNITGRSYAGGATTWPWPAMSYGLTSPEFDVVAAEIRVTRDGNVIGASIDAPTAGYRLVDLQGNSHGANPVRNAVVEATLTGGETRILTPVSERIAGGRTEWTFAAEALEGVASLQVTDGYGNRGTVAF